MKTIKILGIDYEVRVVTFEELRSEYPDNHPDIKSIIALVGENGEDFGGMCDVNACKIWINKNLSSKKKEKVLLHEVMEIINAEALTEIEHSKLQAIVNALFVSGLIDFGDYLNEPVKKSRARSKIRFA